jgi:hypothetical protein
VRHPFIGAFYRHVASGEREVTTFTLDSPGNREASVILGQLRVLPKHWWEGSDPTGKKRDIGATKPPEYERKLELPRSVKVGSFLVQAPPT